MTIWFLIILEWIMFAVSVVLAEWALNRQLRGK
jgi:hypothetical protein